MRRMIIAGFVALGLCGDLAAGSIYKCTDVAGNVSFSQTVCPGESSGGKVGYSAPSWHRGSDGYDPYSINNQDILSEPVLKDIDKAIENQRDLRATKQGISREMLDRMEGRDVEGTASIKITKKTQRRSASGKYLYVEGVLKNTSGETAESVKVKVKALDIRGMLVLLESCYSDPMNLGPRQEGTFSMMIPNNKRIKKFNYTVQHK